MITLICHSNGRNARAAQALDEAELAKTSSVKGDTLMSIISWIILGLIAGFVGAKLVKGEGQGFWLNIALGIIGAIVGGFLFDLFGATGVTGLNIWSMIVAIMGSVVVLLIYNALMARRA